MSDWVTWIIQVVAYGLIAFLLKRELTQLDDRFKRLNDRIDSGEKQASTDIDAVDKTLNDTISGLPFQYTLREDFIRSVAGFDAKLDKILDQLNRRQ